MKHKQFTDKKKAFEFFWASPGKRNEPFLCSDDIIGHFSFRDIQGFKSREEGKEYAYKDFCEWIEDYKR